MPVEAGHVTVSLAPVLLQIMAAELPAAMLLLPSAKAQPLAAVHMGSPPDQAHAACIGSDLKKSGTRCIKLMLPATKDARPSMFSTQEARNDGAERPFPPPSFPPPFPMSGTDKLMAIAK